MFLPSQIQWCAKISKTLKIVSQFQVIIRRILYKMKNTLSTMEEQSPNSFYWNQQSQLSVCIPDNKKSLYYQKIGNENWYPFLWAVDSLISYLTIIILNLTCTTWLRRGQLPSIDLSVQDSRGKANLTIANTKQWNYI